LDAWKGSSRIAAQTVAERMGRLARTLLALSAGLTAVLIVAWLTPWLDLPEARDEAAGEVLTERALRLADHHVEAAEVVRATTGKAVFRTNQALPDKVVDELGRYELKGFIRRDGKVWACVRDVKRKKTLTKGVGELLEPFEITGIDRGGVRLRRGNEELYLTK